MLKFRFTNLFVIALLVFFSACNTEKAQIQPGNDPAGLVQARNGLLVFRSYQDFIKIRQELSSASRQELDQWEAKFPAFASQRFIFESIVDDDLLHKSQVQKLPAGEVDKLKSSLGDDFYYGKSVLANKALLAFDDYGYSLSILGHDPYIEYFVNKDGLVQIGDSIFQYKENSIKIIRDGQYSKVAQLNDLQESSIESNVSVINVRRLDPESSKGSNLRTTFYNNTSCTGLTGGGGQRVIGQSIIGEKSTTDVYGSLGYPGQLVFQPYAYFRAENQYHGLFGWETKRTAHLRIYATNVSYNIREFSGSGITIDQGTNGELRTSIVAYVYGTNNWYPGLAFALNFSGDVTYWGRDGSTCSN